MFRLTSCLRQVVKNTTKNDSRLGKGFYNLIKLMVEQNNIKRYEITDVKFNQKGEGFMSEICSLVLINKDTQERMRLIAKMTVRDEKTREDMCIRISFQNEIYFYRVVHPLFETFFQPEESFKQDGKFAPKCYAACTTEKSEGLILKNLKADGFQVLPKKNILDQHHLRLIFRTYGKFHAISHALKRKHNNFYNQAIVGIKPAADQVRDINNKNFQNAILHFCHLAYSTLIPGRDDYAMKNFQKYLTDPIELYKSSLIFDDRYSVILHGDCWSNNMMFAYRNLQDASKPTDIRFIDWQLSKVGNPMCDLSYCMYSGAGKEELDRIERYLGAYIDSFYTTLRGYEIDPAEVYPIDRLGQDWLKHSKFGMFMAFFLWKIKLTDRALVRTLSAGSAAEDTDINLFMSAPCDEVEYKKRIRELILHMNDIGAL